MKINKMDKIMKIYNNEGSNKVKKNKNKLGKDQIKLSDKAKDIQVATKKLKEVPDIRKEKVEGLKEKVQSGNYNIEGKKIAEKMYENINFDKKV